MQRARVHAAVSSRPVRGDVHRRRRRTADHAYRGRNGVVTASSTRAPPVTDAPATARGSDVRIDEHPLRLVGSSRCPSAGVRLALRTSAVSVLLLLTPSWRVKQPHAVATVVARDPLSLMTWGVLTVLTHGALSLRLAYAALGSVVAVVLIPVLLVAAPTAMTRVGAAHHRMADSCGSSRTRWSSPTSLPTRQGHGHGTALMADHRQLRRRGRA